MMAERGIKMQVLKLTKAILGVGFPLHKPYLKCLVSIKGTNHLKEFWKCRICKNIWREVFLASLFPPIISTYILTAATIEKETTASRFINLDFWRASCVGWMQERNKVGIEKKQNKGNIYFPVYTLSENGPSQKEIHLPTMDFQAKLVVSSRFSQPDSQPLTVPSIEVELAPWRSQRRKIGNYVTDREVRKEGHQPSMGGVYAQWKVTCSNHDMYQRLKKVICCRRFFLQGVVVFSYASIKMLPKTLSQNPRQKKAKCEANDSGHH